MNIFLQNSEAMPRGHEATKLVSYGMLGLFWACLITGAMSALAQSPVSGDSTRSAAGSTTMNLNSSADAAAGSASDDAGQDSTTVFEHTPARRYWVSGQINIIGQAHPGFPA